MKEKFYVDIAGIKLGIVSEEGKEYVDSIAKAVVAQLASNTMVKQRASNFFMVSTFLM